MEDRAVARALVRFAGLRVLLFLVALVLARLVVRDVVLSLALAFLISAVLGVPLLRRYRQELATATAARAARRRSEPPTA